MVILVWNQCKKCPTWQDHDWHWETSIISETKICIDDAILFHQLKPPFDFVKILHCFFPCHSDEIPFLLYPPPDTQGFLAVRMFFAEIKYSAFWYSCCALHSSAMLIYILLKLFHDVPLKDFCTVTETSFPEHWQKQDLGLERADPASTEVNRKTTIDFKGRGSGPRRTAALILHISSYASKVWCTHPCECYVALKTLLQV